MKWRENSQKRVTDVLTRTPQGKGQRREPRGESVRVKGSGSLGVGDTEKLPPDFVKRSAEDLPESSQKPAWEGHTWERRQRGGFPRGGVRVG